MKFLLAVVIMVGAMVGGLMSPHTTQAAEADLIGTKWQLVALGAAGAENPVVPNSQATLEFGFDSGISGMASCNNYGGEYTISEDTISFGRIVSTLMACLDDATMSQEQTFLEALQAATRYELTDDGRLIIAYGNNQQMIFVPLIKLANTAWQLVSFVDNGEITPIVIDTQPTLIFGEDGNVGGQTGCNSWGGTYAAQNESLSISELVKTEVFCVDEGVADQESVYLAGLMGAHGFSIVDGQLVIGYGRDSQLVFDPMSVLEGTTWLLVSFVQTDTVASAIVDSSITLEFVEDNQVVGLGGCNNYNASYEATDRLLSFSPVISTRMACSPNDIMTQEQTYFNALDEAIGYEVLADQLIIYYGDGNSLIFIRTLTQ